MAEKHETVIASDPEARKAKGHTLKPELALAALRRAWDDCPKPERDRFLREVLQEQKPHRAKGDEQWLIELGRRLRATGGVKDWAYLSISAQDRVELLTTRAGVQFFHLLDDRDGSKSAAAYLVPAGGLVRFQKRP